MRDGDPTDEPACAACGVPMPLGRVSRITVRTVDGSPVEVDPECHNLVRLAHPAGYAAPSGTRLFLRSHRAP